LISELEVDNLHPMTINYSSELQHLAIGSRQGSLLVYSLSEDLSSATLLQNIPNLHKKESLTSLRYTATNLITCGRDGAYTILTPSTNYSVQLYSKITKGWLENIQLINNSPLISYFFQKRLHCLNLDTNEEVFSIACGGGHREWYLMPEDENLVNGSVVYLRKEKIIIYPIGSNSESNQNGGEFDLVLKGGLHGREIRTLTQTLNSDLLITGAEAGTLKLLQKSQNSLTSKLNLKAHSSVISKLLTIEFNSNTYLISAGGCEELKVWSINAEDLAMKEVFNSPIYSVDLEVRIMDLHYVESDGLLIVGYSDGYLRVFKFVEDGSVELKLVKATNFLDSCVLSITSATNNNNLTILAIGTVSGKVGYFELDSLINSEASCEPFKVDKVHQNGVNCLTGQYENNQIMFASGGEDNSIGIINIIEDESNNFGTKFELFKSCNDSAIQGKLIYTLQKFC
jgi:WD40 repeat protein